MPVNKLKQLLSNQFIRNISWLGGAELVNRAFRLGTTVTLARMFSSYDYGLVSIVFTTAEFAGALTLKYGIGAKIIQADEQYVKTICNTAYWLNWILCLSLFIIQCLAAFPIAQFYGNNQLIAPICTIALTYLMMPFYLVQSAMIQRENRLKVTALCNAIQAIVANIATVILALLGMGVWAVVLPVVFTTPVWIIITHLNHAWRPPKFFKLERWQEIAYFGKNMLFIDLLGKLRGNLDYLLIGRFLGIEALGLYYFAFNSGFGISANVMNAFFSALFPHLCAVRGNLTQFRERYFKSIKTMFMIFTPLIIMQSCLAPFYVPIIFGDKWKEGIPILMIICLSALPHAFLWGCTIVLDAMDKTHISLKLEIIFAIISISFILISVQWGILWVAVAITVSKLLVIPIFMPVSQKYLKS